MTDELGRATAKVANDVRQKFAITVSFELVDGAEAEFCRLARENAERSVAMEAGCRRFDVLTPAPGSGAQAVLLYEIYEDRDAFAAHVESVHYFQFDQSTRDLVRTKTVLEFTVFENANPE